MPSDNKSFMLTTKAKLGDVNAQLELGLMHYKSSEPEKDIEKAMYWFEKASSNDNMNAMYYLGCIYEFEKKEYVKAAQFYEKAASKGHTEAQRALAYFYLSGSGVQRDAKKALVWFTIAAEGNNSEAQFYLGEFYCFGHGIPVNIDKAIYWYKLAAANNYEQAKSRLREISTNVVEYVKPSSKLETESIFFKGLLSNIKGERYFSEDIPLNDFLINVCQGLSFNMRAHLSYAESSRSSMSNLFLQGSAYMFSKAVEAAMLVNFPEEFTFDFKKIHNPEYSSSTLKHAHIIKEAQEIGKEVLMTVLKEAKGLGIKTFSEKSLWVNETNSNIKLKHEEKMLIKWIPLLGLAYSSQKGYLGLVYV
jgi:TPR repeat protein